MIKSRSAAVRLLALAFALGALAGGAAIMVAERGNHHPEARAGGRQGYLTMLKDELGLSAGQEKAVTDVLDRHEPVMDSIWRTVRPQFDAERQAARRDIRAVLTAEQVAKFDAMMARRDSAHRAKEDEHGKK